MESGFEHNQSACSQTEWQSPRFQQIVKLVIEWMSFESGLDVSEYVTAIV